MVQRLADTFRPRQPQIITVTAGRHPQNEGKILRSVNGGRNWSPVNIPVTTPTDWNNVQVSQRERNGQRYYYAAGVRSGNRYALAGLRGELVCAPLELWRFTDRRLGWTKLAGPTLVQPQSNLPQGGCVENVDIAPSPTVPADFTS